MYYDFPLLIPRNTTKASPVESQLNLTWGVIVHVAIRFPPNCAGQAHVMIMEHRHQVWPTNLDDWFYGDSETIEWDEYHELYELPAAFTLLGYNTDDRFPHTPIVRFNILHPQDIVRSATDGLNDRVRHIPLEVLNGA